MSDELRIRPTEPADVPAVLAIYDTARAFMAQNGNPTQWAGAYPGRADVLGDIEQGCGYVVEHEGRVVGAFAFIIGDDPTYQVIEDGAWGHDDAYGTIHRIASDGSVRGVARACFDFCSHAIDYLRIDTHLDNAPMRAAVVKFGFVPRGTIYCEDGTPRIAFDWHR